MGWLALCSQSFWAFLGKQGSLQKPCIGLHSVCQLMFELCADSRVHADVAHAKVPFADSVHALANCCCPQALCRDARCVPAGGASELEMARQVSACTAYAHSSLLQACIDKL